MTTESSETCVIVPDGKDTNGDEWSRCTVHDQLVLGNPPFCEGYVAPAYQEQTVDDKTQAFIPGRCVDCGYPNNRDHVLEAHPFRPIVAGGVDRPDYYYIDGGNAYWLFGGILQSAPLSVDGTPIWADGGDVEFSRIDAYLVTYALGVQRALETLEKLTLTMRGWGR